MIHSSSMTITQTLAAAVAVCGISLSFKNAAYGQSSLPAVAAEISAAKKALSENLPQVAVTRLNSMLARTTGISAEESKEVSLLLVEAQIRADKSEEALATLAKSTDVEGLFWRATALQKLRRFSQALLTWEAWLAHEKAESAPFATKVLAHRNHIATLAALGRHKAALEQLKVLRGLPNMPAAEISALEMWDAELLLRSENPSEALVLLSKPAPIGADVHVRSYLTGQAYLGLQRYGEAISSFRLATNSPSNRVAGAAHLGLARATRLEGSPVRAAQGLQEFILSHKESAWLRDAFEELALCNQPRLPVIEAQLKTWAGEDAASSLASLAALCQLKSNLNESASEQLVLSNEFLERFPKSPDIHNVRLRRVALFVLDERLPQAKAELEILAASANTPAVQKVVQEMTAYLSYAKEDFSVAQQAFQDLSKKSPEPVEGLRLAYNAALSSLQQGRSLEEALSLLNAVQPSEGSGSEWLGSLLLEKALLAAAEEDQDNAINLLDRFLSEHAQHPRRFQGLMTMAELRREDPKWLARVFEAAKAPAERRQALLLELDLLAARRSEQLLERTEQFLTEDPVAPEKADLLFQAGEIAYHNKLHNKAALLFQRSAQVARPDSELASAAYYWAGRAHQAAMSSGTVAAAIQSWESAANLLGPFRHKARLALARMELRRGNAVAAQAHLTKVLEDKQLPPEVDTRYAVLCQIGEIYSSDATATPTQLEAAIRHCDTVINAEGAGSGWRQQASFHRAVILELLKKPDEALAGFYATMTPPITPEPILESADYHWFLRAGEKALAILEARQDWKGAVAMAQKMGRAPGVLGEAARTKAERLKTLHLIWEE